MKLLLTIMILLFIANIAFILWLIDEVQLLVESVQLLFEQYEVNDVLSDMKLLKMRREKEND